MKVLTVMIATLAVLLALMANLLLKPKATSRMATVFGWSANVLGFLLYGYGYAVLESNVLMAILKTIYAVFGMFLGKDAMSDMQALPFFDLSIVKLLLYLAQMFALYLTASAAISAFGSTLINQLRGLMLRFGPVHLVYGVTDETLEIGKQIEDGGQDVAFIDDSVTDEERRAIRELHGVYLIDALAQAGSAKFLKRIGIGKRPRKIVLYAIGESPAANIAYAEKFLKALETVKAPMDQTRLVLCAEENYDVAALQGNSEKYGYGNIFSFERPDLAARIMIEKCPPFENIQFGERGLAEENFEALIIGFGDVGREVLKKVVQNAQFPGSHFHATVFDPQIQHTDGNFRYRYQGMLDAYDIDLVPGDGRSFKIFEYIRDHAKVLKYIVISTGSKSMNEHISRDLQGILSDFGSEAALIECSLESVNRIYYANGKKEVESWPIFTNDLISTDKLDEMAMILNQYYMKSNGKSKEDNWRDCDYFSRMSNRASADFIPAFLAISGKKEEDVRKNGWMVSDQMMEVLGIAEHDRWCAFHYAHGFIPMDKAEWYERAEIYRKQKEEKGKASIKIGKDMAHRHHVCLIPWDELDELSEREATVTGKNPEYKQMDIANIKAIPELLKQKTGN
ncbi:MAG: hypothetical protein IJM83_12550 [Firmicutes bacterium]|nr:hypothetical protein [Bacillota bacterium]